MLVALCDDICEEAEDCPSCLRLSLQPGHIADALVANIAEDSRKGRRPASGATSAAAIAAAQTSSPWDHVAIRASRGAVQVPLRCFRHRDLQRHNQHPDADRLDLHDGDL